ncbi:cysteine desulfurase family protein [Brevibacillus laterosporus]|uniref:cysteine desulfurase family protein n=1 Tax=Brevibacillus laterosporus TaxID=1465 RepID=UPI0026557CB6|nr:cysteine desulfurase family protein [Brevibacillus laterosporus]MDN9010826.1 cysteine desulfurase family protein [Brevibacillus laterosporus]MDO0941849.1 cysteine desulfurase family protein [Brevibacillus laterosporus]
MNSHVYLDNAATTPVHPQVIAAMQPYFTEVYGNPSSIHGFGREARKALEKARETIADFLGADPSQIIFTSGGTEADNMALIGGALANEQKGKHIITTQIEHHAVLHACEHLERMGFEVTYLPVDKTGMVSLDDVKKAIRPDTILVSIMYGNNEVGTIQPIQEIGSFLQEQGILFHSDCVQAFGLLRIKANELPVDLISLSAHKINGPKGVGALCMGRKTTITPYLHGGAQERKRRAGTENLAGIVGFAQAIELMRSDREERRQKYLDMRQAMLQVFREAGIAFEINGHEEHFLPHILNVSFLGVNTETMLFNLDLAGIAAASGSACTSGSLELSHVLTAMNLPKERSHTAIRFSFGMTNTTEEVTTAAQKIVQIVKRLVK